ncbi:putative glycosyl hydrolase [Aspergillus homomorphus CBS 101889]|uniref:Glycosyl hydrolase n=1 Tax=Aspergillus homomorphus (strain CBS 101889) TaxID=1450537 RepID=A0A395HYN3_ASPHC|nr:glycosyl hydrolase [Aspergillus homomorphus CBS 101889]RAL11978.1 glycosyl hydrolase [Aspergillus homomorphus CBS 101889]
MHLRRFFGLSALLPLISGFVLSPGDTATIPGWDLQSSLQAKDDPRKLSQPDAKTDSWHRISSRSTVMAGLLQAGVHNETDLFYSDHMKAVDLTPFQSPWLYREEFGLQSPPNGGHLFLVTHGISSKADIFFNGAQVASSEFQQGCFGGHQYDITSHVRSGKNALLVQAYPTNYLADFGQGFADWNPYPPDNGTGVWRDIELKQTGPISLSPVRILTDFKGTPSDQVTVTVIADVTNQNNIPIQGSVKGLVEAEDGTQRFPFETNVRLNPNENTTVSIPVSIKTPQIWWPAAWGRQPLYAVQLNVTTPQGTISDRTPRTTFGIRHVASQLSADKDVSFSINGLPFLVRGAGYAPDLFLRFNVSRIRTIFRYVLDMGLNTIRLEGKLEQPEFYEMADRMGIMILAGWECCDKWEGWDYNPDGKGIKWDPTDYTVAFHQMYHESTYLQPHPSLLGFLLGSDYWPNDAAAASYLDALTLTNWSNPIISSASTRGHPSTLPPSGMKMLGPYDWVPPNYWTPDPTPQGVETGTAYGFGSEQGPGVGTPGLSSLSQFLSPGDLQTLWHQPRAGHYHMSTGDSEFYTRALYNTALFQRYGHPTSLEDYLQKAQLIDYEATRAEFDGFALNQNNNATRPATGVIYWMLNSAWPSLHWQLFDFYLRPAGAYFGVKASTAGGATEHLAYDYTSREVSMINHAIVARSTPRTVEIELIAAADGRTLSKQTVNVPPTDPGTSVSVAHLPDDAVAALGDNGVGFLRLILRDSTPTQQNTRLSRTVYWLSRHNDELDWSRANWYTTPVTKYANFKGLSALKTAAVTGKVSKVPHPAAEEEEDSAQATTLLEISLENQADVPAFFLHVTVVGPDGAEIAPVYWSENFVTLFPRERLALMVRVPRRERDGWAVVVDGVNVERRVVGRG